MAYEAWPDFITFYGTTATSAGWIVPKKYVEAVGDAGFLKAPIPEVQDLYERQSREMDRRKGEDLLHQIQRPLYERAIFAPIWENGFIRGVGPCVLRLKTTP